jgi:hypothetical protein
MGFLSDLFGTAGNQQQLQDIAGKYAGIANQAQQTGTQMQQPLLTGNLPPAAQALVSETLTSNLANMRNAFSRLGLTGSTMEATGLSEEQLASLAQTFGIETDMFKLGLQSINQALAGIGGETTAINDIANLNLTETGDLMNAIASIAGAAGKAAAGGGGGGGGFSLDIPGVGPANAPVGDSSGMGGWH